MSGSANHRRSQPAAKDPRIGRVIANRYRVLKRVATGGMGVVYRGERVAIGRAVAVKFLHQPLVEDKRYREIFAREARAMGRLSHPHCLPILDFGIDDAPYLVMDFVSGQTLKALTARRPIRWPRAVHITRQLLAGLAHAHGHAIVHGDVKPANIMLTEVTGLGDYVRLVDFGLARLREEAANAEPTDSGMAMGTPQYMAPEQWQGQQADERTDIYATGIVLYEMLAGERPFPGEDKLELMKAHLHKAPPRLSGEHLRFPVPRPLEAIVMKAIAKDPERRFQKATDFQAALQTLADQDARQSTLLRHPAAFVRLSSRSPDDEPWWRHFGRPWSRAALVACGVLAGTWAWAIGGHSEPAEPAVIAGPAVSDQDPSSMLPTAVVAPPRPAGSSVKSALEAQPALAAQAHREGADDGSAEPAQSAPSAGDESLTQAQVEEAMQALIALRRQHPGDADIAFRLGKLYFLRGWHRDAFLRYGDAMRLDPSYGTQPEVIDQLLEGLAINATHPMATRLLVRHVGEAALPALRRLQADDSIEPLVRRRALWVERAIERSATTLSAAK